MSRKCRNVECEHDMTAHDGDGYDTPFECLIVGCECIYYEDV